MKALEVVFWHKVDRWGQAFVKPFNYTYYVVQMIYLAFRAGVMDRSQGIRSIFSVVSGQIYFTGWQALPLISVLALVSGSIVILQSLSQLSLIGNAEIVGNLLVIVIVREVSPFLTALIVIARSGTAVASEIGNMKVNREIEALETMAIHPLSYVVFPRILGGTISVLCLSFYFIVVALLGGFLVTRLVDSTPFSFYLDSLALAASMEDLGLFVLKNFFSGIIIFSVCCYQGLAVKSSPHEVPQMTTAAVVNSVIYVALFNLVITTFFYLYRLKQLGIL